jgi:hypothetical protein
MVRSKRAAYHMSVTASEAVASQLGWAVPITQLHFQRLAALSLKLARLRGNPNHSA